MWKRVVDGWDSVYWMRVEEVHEWMSQRRLHRVVVHHQAAATMHPPPPLSVPF